MGIQKKSLSYFVLTVLEKTIDGYVRFEDFTYHHYRYQYGIPELKKSALAKAIARLKEGGLVIEERVDEGKLLLKLTDEGRIELLLKEEEIKNWDGKWRIVVFDIPEQKRLIRDLLRRNLKRWGFKQRQKSVWISKKNLTDKLMDYIKDLGIEDWVMVIESNKIGPLPEM